MEQDDFKKRLTSEQYRVTQQKGTEAPFTGEYDDFFEDGQYKCVVCGYPLFESDSKYDAGCGWPSFSDTRHSDNIKQSEDKSIGMIRTEVACGHCGAHLGHVFDDGPKPTGKRYCINSAALNFEEK